jgi:hypothetical protein
MAVEEAAPPTEESVAATWPFRFEIVPLDELDVDHAYQRPLTSFWKVVKEKFNPALVGTLIISHRKTGKKVIIDGQTRWTSMTELSLPNAPCLIYEGLSKADEARLFAELQTQRRSMRSYDRFRAELVAKLPRAVEVSRIATDLGFELSADEVAGKTIKAIAALEKTWSYSPEHLEDVLGIIRDAWGNEDLTATKAEIINGLSHFLRYQEGIDLDRLVSRLAQVTPNMLSHRASALREGGRSGGGATIMAEAILGEYGRRGRRS